MKRLLFYICLFFLSIHTSFAQKVIVRGRVTDAKTGEMLSDANVLEKRTGIGMATNTYGLFSLSVSTGKCLLQCSMVGYVTWMDTVEVFDDKVINIMLNPDEYILKGIEVTGVRKHSGQFTLDSKEIQAIPVAGGESDLIKSLQLLPGVQSGNEGANNISVRGGSQWGNLVLLDEAVVYNPNHALSFFSVFNNDAIQKVNLYKSYFPLKYGGRSSSVIDVRMRDGNSKERKRNASLGLIASKVLLEGPMKKGAYLVAGRLGYPGPTVSLLGSKLTSKPQMLFYDVNGKINVAIDEYNRLFFSLYSGGDHTVFNKLVKNYGMDWGNATATVRWNHLFNSRTNMNTSAVFSNYYYGYKSLSDGLRYLWKSDMQSYQLKSDWETHLDNSLTIKSGASLHYFATMPGAVEKYGDESNVVPSRLKSKRLLDIVLYGEGEYKFLSKFQLNAGIRISLLYAPSSTSYTAKTYIVPEPRAELSYIPDAANRISFSFTQAVQSIHMLTTSSVGIPSDMWIPTNALLKPMVMRQMAIGYEYNSPHREYTFSTEAYLRRINHIVDYKKNANIFLNDHIEGEVETGTAKGCGVEFYISKNQGQLTGWLGYTLSRTWNNINGEKYKSIYDRPHNLKLFLNWNLGKYWSLSSVFSYASGMNLTVPIGKYHSEHAVFYIYSDRNGYRAPAYHQLDFSATYRMKKERNLTFSLINLYNRKNVFSIYAGREGYSSVNYSKIYKLYLYGIVPSLTYSFKF